MGMSSTKILAKIETRQALLNFHGILSEADGIIISRGNLGLDCEPEKMALVQKTVIQVRVYVFVCVFVCVCVGGERWCCALRQTATIIYICSTISYQSLMCYFDTHTHTQACNLMGKPVVLTRVVDTMVGT